MPKVFISHSSADREFVERELIFILNNFGIDTWYAKDEISTAADWERAIRTALAACDWFLVVLSPNAVTSDWVKSEVAWALEQRKNRIVPVLYRTCDPDELHLKLRLIQHVDYRESQEVARSKLLNAWKLNYAPKLDQPNYISEPFPVDRLIQWVPKVRTRARSDKAQNYPLVITQEVLLKLSEHVSEGLKHEMDPSLKAHRRGFLIGNLYRCPDTNRDYVVADQILTLDYTKPAGDPKGFTNDSWRLLDEELGRLRGRLLLGWYESVTLSIYFSQETVATHEKYFPQPWMKAIVVELTKKTGGIVGWNHGKVNWGSFEDFYELIGHYARTSVVAWEDYAGTDMKTNAPPELNPRNTASVVPPLKPFQDSFELKTGNRITDFLLKQITGKK